VSESCAGLQLNMLTQNVDHATLKSTSAGSKNPLWASDDSPSGTRRLRRASRASPKVQERIEVLEAEAAQFDTPLQTTHELGQKANRLNSELCYPALRNLSSRQSGSKAYSRPIWFHA
jgi:hypothetical protein